MKKNLIINASLIIPLYNNEGTLEKQLLKCENVLGKICNKYEIIIAEDNSTDSSAKLLKKIFLGRTNFTLIFNRKNLGISKNIKKLYKKAKYDNVILFSVDGAWIAEDIGKILLFAIKNNADIAIGKRPIKDYSFYRKFVSFCYNSLPYVFFKVNTMDAGSLKVIKRDLIYSLPSISKSVFFEAELIIRASREGKKIISMPIHYNIAGKKGGGGNYRLVISSLIDLINLRLRI